MIKRKDMEGHRSQCPLEPVECPFAEAGCKVNVCRHQLDDHMTTSLHQHVTLLMIDRKQLKRELNEVKAKLSKAETELNETKHKLSKAETEIDEAKARLTTELGADFSYLVNKLEKYDDSVILLMHSFSKYHRSGKVWHSPPFYYREGYKMCLAVHANGVGEGAGTHVSVTLILLKGECDSAQHQSEGKCPPFHFLPFTCTLRVGETLLNVCQYKPLSQYSEAVKELGHNETFCTHKYIVSKLVNDCITFSITYCKDDCHLLVSVK